MIEPLRLSFEVACDPQHAFETWTARAAAWWPREHTFTHAPGVAIVFEPRVGGRIYERTESGLESEWGKVTAWEPPRRLAYLWHIAAPPADATDVEIRFMETASGVTRVEIEHGGWDRLGAEKGLAWRDVNTGGWQGVLPDYAAACSKFAAGANL